MADTSRTVGTSSVSDVHFTHDDSTLKVIQCTGCGTKIAAAKGDTEEIARSASPDDD